MPGEISSKSASDAPNTCFAYAGKDRDRQQRTGGTIIRPLILIEIESRLKCILTKVASLFVQLLTQCEPPSTARGTDNPRLVIAARVLRFAGGLRFSTNRYYIRFEIACLAFEFTRRAPRAVETTIARERPGRKRTSAAPRRLAQKKRFFFLEREWGALGKPGGHANYFSLGDV